MASAPPPAPPAPTPAPAPAPAPATNTSDTICDTPPSAWAGWTQSGAQAYYACRFYAAQKDTNWIRNAIAATQAATQIYFADQQYEIAKQAQDRLDNISNIELERSGKLFNQFEKGIGQEDAQLARAVERLNVPEPNYEEIRLRVTASVVRQFTEAKRKVEQCYPVSCMEARCNALGKIETEQAKAIASEVEQAYQKERALYELRTATARTELMEVLKFGRGALYAAHAALAGAQTATIQASNINPYNGWIQAVNGISQTAQGISMQEALSFRGMGVNIGSAQNLAKTGNTVTSEITRGPASTTFTDYQPQIQSQFQDLMIGTMLTNSGDGTISGEVNGLALNTTGGYPIQG